jgi:PDZ domain-containing secreted protein
VKIDATLKAGTGTDAETLQKEEEAINIDGLNVKQVKELRDKVSHKYHENPQKVSFKRIP